jgi:transposase
MEKESLELLLGQGFSVEKIAKRFGKDPSTVSYWMAKYGLEAVNREKHAAKGGINQNRLATMVEAGMTIAQMAEAVGLSKTTVRYWLRAYGLKTQNGRGRAASVLGRAAKAAGKLTVTMSCAKHGETEWYLEGRGYYRCKRCRVDAVAQRRRKVKAILIAEAGGGCLICGYDRHPRALEFHHLDPLEKRLEINAKGVALALDKLRAEARKCVLLCANCHAEIEAGAATVPLQFRPEVPNNPLTPQ